MPEPHVETAFENARRYFLDAQNRYGCAETTFIILKQVFGLSEPDDSSPAMAMNGGVAYRGNICGAITGAAMSLGMLADRRVPDHRLAKRAARRILDQFIDQFQSLHGAINCRELIEMDIHDDRQHLRFIQGGIWRTRCMSQIELAVRSLAPLADEDRWESMVKGLSAP